MPPNDSELSAGTDLVGRVLGLEVDNPLNLDELRQAVKRAIARLISDEFGRLASTMYQLDVDEQQVEAVFASNPAQDLPGALSTLVIDRLVQKLATRRLYRDEVKRPSDDHPGPL